MEHPGARVVRHLSALSPRLPLIPPPPTFYALPRLVRTWQVRGFYLLSGAVSALSAACPEGTTAGPNRVYMVSAGRYPGPMSITDPRARRMGLVLTHFYSPSTNLRPPLTRANPTIYAEIAKPALDPSARRITIAAKSAVPLPLFLPLPRPPLPAKITTSFVALFHWIPRLKEFNSDLVAMEEVEEGELTTMRAEAAWIDEVGTLPMWLDAPPSLRLPAPPCACASLRLPALLPCPPFLPLCPSGPAPSTQSPQSTVCDTVQLP